MQKDCVRDMNGAHVFLAGILYECCFFTKRPIRAKLVRLWVFLTEGPRLGLKQAALPSDW